MKRRETIFALLLVLISFSSILPFCLNSILMDYDAPQVEFVIRHAMEGGTPYRPKRVPGSPTHDMAISMAFKIMTSAGIPFRQAEMIYQWITWMMSMVLALLFFKILLKSTSPPVAFVIALCFVLHPLFLWHEWSIMEDMFSLTLVFGGWYLLTEKNDLDLSAVLMAIGSCAKGLGVVYGVAALVYVLMKHGRKQALRYGGIYGALSFFMYAPALAYYGMDLRTAAETQHYGTAPHDRPAIGWVLGRDTLLYYIPVIGALAFSYVPRFLKKNFRPIKPADIWIFFLVGFCFIDFNRYGYKYFFLLVTLPFLVQLIAKTKKTKDPTVLCYFIMVVGVFYMAFSAPYSRSFFLFSIAPLLLLLLHRFKSPVFWGSVLAITFLPMFYYFQFRGKPAFFKLWPRGFYSAHILAGTTGIGSYNNEYNDGGLTVLTPVLTIPPAAPVTFDIKEPNEKNNRHP